MLQHHPHPSKTLALSGGSPFPAGDREHLLPPEMQPCFGERAPGPPGGAGALPVPGWRRWNTSPRANGHMRRQNPAAFPLRPSSGWTQDPPAFNRTNPLFSQALHKLPRRSETEHPPSSSIEKINLRSWYVLNCHAIKLYLPPLHVTV